VRCEPHAGCGERVGETGWPQGRHRAPARLNRQPGRIPLDAPATVAGFPVMTGSEPKEQQPRLFANRWTNAGPGDARSDRDQCRCLGRRLDRPQRSVKFHKDRQDTEAAAWRRLLELTEEAAEDRREEFNPLVELGAEQRRQVVTLPPTIAKLTPYVTSCCMAATWCASRRRSGRCGAWRSSPPTHAPTRASKHCRGRGALRPGTAPWRLDRRPALRRLHGLTTPRAGFGAAQVTRWLLCGSFEPR
jgi:hypothetical protein